MNTNTNTNETCDRCGESIRFLRMGNSAKWVSSTSNPNHAHSPKRGPGVSVPVTRWDTTGMKRITV